MNKACATGDEGQGGWKTFKSVQLKEYGDEITKAWKRFTSRIPEEAAGYAQRFNLEQKAAILLAEEKQASREEEAMLRFLASMRLQSWWRGCLGKKAFQAAKHLVLMTYLRRLFVPTNC